MAEDVEAILTQAKKLWPLLDHAEQVMLKHQEAKGALTFQTGKAFSSNSLQYVKNNGNKSR